MADQENRAVILGQHIFQNIQGFHVEVIGRFVQDKDV